MNYNGGSGKWILAVIAVVLAVIAWCYPSQCLFILRFIRDLIVLNLRPILQAVQAVFKH
jgi:hypothetical protein